jgi:hypothetical protein
VSAPQKVIGSLFALLAAVIMLGSTEVGSVAGRGLDWDPRLDALNVTLHPAADCSGGCWRLTSARFEDSDESGGLHHIFGRLVVDGNAPGGLPWHVAYPGDDIRIFTKPAPEWADFPMFAEYDPDEGQAGPYRAYAGDSEGTSDVVRGMGLPERQHVNFRLIWQWSSGGPTVTPTATPTPSHWLYLPIVQK